MSWNFGDLFDAVARVVPPDRAALVHGETVLSWRAFDRRTNNIARAMIRAGLAPDDRIAILARNHPAFVEVVVAALKARLSYVNINYRYGAEEIAYVLRDCGARGLFFQTEFEANVRPLPQLAPDLQQLVRMDAEGGGTLLEDWAEDGDGAALQIERSPDDSYLLYTGGTTGRPKGVVWRQGDARASQLESPLVRVRPTSVAEHVAIVRANAAPGRVLPACPMMHGAGINSAIAELASGGTVITLTGRRFDAAALWAVAADQRATRILIVGDSFARPMLRALDEAPGAYDLSALRVISSAGTMWSAEVRAGLLRHLPQASLVDILGASEAPGLGYAVSTAGHVVPTGLFDVGPTAVLIDADGHVVPAGMAGEGHIARSAPLPVGYHGDAVKSAEIFRTIGGVRYGIPGDLARFDGAGHTQLIGRGNLSINTGGEKVSPEEVEEALKRLPGVEDALVVGIPDEQFGRAVAALIQPGAGCVFDAAQARLALAPHLAGYKIPRVFTLVQDVPRHESGKADYRRAAAMAAAPEPSRGER